MLHDAPAKAGQDIYRQAKSPQDDAMSSAEQLKSAYKNTTAPKDKWKVNYYIFFFVGFSSLFSWHIFIKNSFFEERFASTIFATTFSNWIARVYMATNLLAMVFLMLLPERLKGSNSLRVSLSFLGNVAVFLAMTVLPPCEWIPDTTYFYITLVCAGLCGFFGGVLQSSLFGMASGFPSSYVQGIMAGQGLAGMVSSVILMAANILAGDSIKSPHEIAINAALYFGLSLFFIVLGYISFMYVQRLEFFKFHSTMSAAPGADLDLSDESIQPPQQGGIFSIFTKMPSALYPPAVFFVLFITLSAFPFIFSNITSSSKSDSFFFRKLFISTGYLLFDVGDYIGKSMPAFGLFYTKSHVFILSSSLLRVVFIPLFMLCNFRDHPDFNAALRIFSSDVIYFSLALLFGLTNGYICSLLFMNAPRTVPEYLREKMGAIMPFFLTVGLALGPFFVGIISLFLKK
ncbi:hypothetical protein MDAP_002151 [Mitosporidium daphniae]